MKLTPTLAAVALFLPGMIAHAQTLPEAFVSGPVIKEFGPSAQVEGMIPLAEDIKLKVVFDIADTEERGGVNRQFETVARFLNMHARAGVDRDAIKPAIVVHGGAAQYLVQPGPTEDATDTFRLVFALLQADVPIYLCGQTAAARGLSKDDLIPGVELSLSAMTAHAKLARDGYSLNPF
ncbi:DsrE family protein [Henriciella marina]|uniref:DsrE family protein n=1 Tax=Henriciella marina TaxID=453851 RepID=A0ABT4LWN3_9PROT|nr:DsrE family protein [Henriciella marina]MCZ4298791.1 DsrE family protein [Henriciella marina]